MAGGFAGADAFAGGGGRGGHGDDVQGWDSLWPFLRLGDVELRCCGGDAVAFLPGMGHLALRHRLGAVVLRPGAEVLPPKETDARSSRRSQVKEGTVAEVSEYA